MSLEFDNPIECIEGKKKHKGFEEMDEMLEEMVDGKPVGSKLCKS